MRKNILVLMVLLVVAGCGGATSDDNGGDSTPAVTEDTKNTTCNIFIESQIDGVFNGWKGNTVVNLINGQIWKQVEPYNHNKYSYRAKVVICSVESGGYEMIVGDLKAVLVERLIPAEEDSPQDNTEDDSADDTADENPPSNSSIDLRIKGTINKAKDFSDDVKYLGEIINSGTGIATFVKILVTSYDSNNNILGIDLAYVNGYQYFSSDSGIGYNSALGNNEFGSFECYTSVSYSQLDRYETEIIYSTSRQALRPPTNSLTISSVIEDVDYFGDRIFTGEIINNGSDTVRFVKIDFTMKNSSGAVIDTDFTYLDGSVCMTLLETTTETCLKPGETKGFEADTFTDATKIASYYYRIYHSE